MTAIETYFIGPTNTRGSRYKAVALGTKHSITIGADDSIGHVENHKRAARALIVKQGWDSKYYGDWYCGDSTRGYVFVCALDHAKVLFNAETEAVS